MGKIWFDKHFCFT